MKKIFSALLLFVFLMAFSQETINFQSGTFKEILAKAKAEKNWFSLMRMLLGAALAK